MILHKNTWDRLTKAAPLTRNEEQRAHDRYCATLLTIMGFGSLILFIYIWWTMPN